mmetsp:Transcript_20799/g.23142  ORF Transcript_20799/g.23142 Transcript_20799/m.23142 type:complete len:598 (+) Transcript_20799:175-1968(+)
MKRYVITCIAISLLTALLIPHSLCCRTITPTNRLQDIVESNECVLLQGGNYELDLVGVNNLLITGVNKNEVIFSQIAVSNSHNITFRSLSIVGGSEPLLDINGDSWSINHIDIDITYNGGGSDEIVVIDPSVTPSDTPTATNSYLFRRLLLKQEGSKTPRGISLLAGHTSIISSTFEGNYKEVFLSKQAADKTYVNIDRCKIFGDNDSDMRVFDCHQGGNFFISNTLVVGAPKIMHSNCEDEGGSFRIVSSTFGIGSEEIVDGPDPTQYENILTIADIPEPGDALFESTLKVAQSVFEDAMNNDYKIKATSSALQFAGTIQSNIPLYDIDNNPRASGFIDIGAYQTRLPPTSAPTLEPTQPPTTLPPTTLPPTTIAPTTMPPTLQPITPTNAPTLQPTTQAPTEPPTEAHFCDGSPPSQQFVCVDGSWVADNTVIIDTVTNWNGTFIINGNLSILASIKIKNTTIRLRGCANITGKVTIVTDNVTNGEKHDFVTYDPGNPCINVNPIIDVEDSNEICRSVTAVPEDNGIGSITVFFIVEETCKTNDSSFPLGGIIGICVVIFFVILIVTIIVLFSFVPKLRNIARPFNKRLREGTLE